MNYTRRNKYSPVGEYIQSNSLRKTYSGLPQTSSQFDDENSYQKYQMGSRWKKFILPEFTEDDESDNEYSKATFSRIASQSRMLQQIQNFNEIADSKIFLSSKPSRRQQFKHPYPIISSFQLRKNETTRLNHDNQQIFQRLQSGGFGSTMKPKSNVSQKFSISIGTQTQVIAPQNYSSQEFELLKQEVLYLRQHVYANLGKNLDSNCEGNQR